MSSGEAGNSGVEVRVVDHVGYVTLDRGDGRNPLNREMRRELVRAFVSFGSDPDVWAVLLRASGSRSFCVGADLKDKAPREGRPSNSPMSSVERSVYEAIWESPKPTVAAIFGWTLGAGCELSLACDLRIAADTLRIGLPESKLGLAANFGAQSLVRLIPRAVAYKMLYTGAHLDAAEAARWGLINEVVPQSDLDARAEEVVREIVASAPLSTQRYKSIITTGAELPFSSALRVTAGPNPYASEDRAEGARAFREKRPPQWRGV